MNILFFVGEFPKLSQTFILNQITGLIDAGHDVKILAKRPAPDRKLHPDVEKYRLTDRVIYYGAGGKDGKIQKGLQFLKGAFGLVAGSAFHGRHAGSISFRDLIRYPNLILLVRTLNRADLSDRDIIMAHFGPNGILALKCLSRGLLRGRLFTAFHGYDMLRYINQKGQGAYRELFSSAAVLLPISDRWRERCIRLGADPSRIIVHHMGIDLKKFRCFPARPGNVIRIVSAARFVEKKGLAYGIEAVKHLIEKGYQVHYEIAGDGPLREDLKHLISQYHLEEDVCLAGWKTQTEWIEMMQNAQIVLAPSVTARDGDMEGIPVQLMEAMAMGKIVVSTYHSGIPELIRDGVNGYLVHERDAGELADKIEDVFKAPEHWADVAENARRTVAEQFNIDRQNERLIRIFEEHKHESM